MNIKIYLISIQQNMIYESVLKYFDFSTILSGHRDNVLHSATLIIPGIHILKVLV